jgi:hypothetical protein
MGRGAMYCNTTGCHNIAIGRSALYTNCTACFNIGIGYRALANNDYNGYGGNRNIAIGVKALYSAQVTSGAIAIGYCALFSSSGGGNLAIGDCSQALTIGGDSNVSVGGLSLCGNLTGSANVAIGNKSFKNNQYGQQTVAVGHNAIAYGSGPYTNQLTAVGYRAGYYFSQVYQIAVGANAQTSNQAYHTVWGAAANSVYNCVWAAWTTVSDARDKANIEPLSRNLGLSLINKLNPVSFKWDQRQRYVDKCGFEYGEKDGTLITAHREYGLIAQELKQALDELGEQFDALKYNSTQDSYRLTYEGLIAPIIKSIQELSARVESIEKKL